MIIPLNTPKERAHYLVIQFLDCFSWGGDGDSYDEAKECAKKAALICAEEVLDYYPTSTTPSLRESMFFEYWKQVQEEISKV